MAVISKIKLFGGSTSFSGWRIGSHIKFGMLREEDHLNFGYTGLVVNSFKVVGYSSRTRYRAKGSIPRLCKAVWLLNTQVIKWSVMPAWVLKTHQTNEELIVHSRKVLCRVVRSYSEFSIIETVGGCKQTLAIGAFETPGTYVLAYVYDRRAYSNHKRHYTDYMVVGFEVV